MNRSGRGAEQDGTGAAAAVPVPVLRAAVPTALSPSVLVDALAALAAADTRTEVAAAALPLLAEQPGVRACAVVGRDGDRAVVLGSAGYECGSMSPGAVLPLDAGLPVTEAVRTGRLVERGSGPAWVAVPFGGSRRSGALLLSLTGGPLATPADVALLQRLARALGDALRRATDQETAFADLALLTASLSGAPAPRDDAVAVRQLPYDGPVGGDVALCLPDGRGGRWLLVADVCGRGLGAAVVARTVHTAASAVAPYVRNPDELLAAVERAVRPDTGPGSFVTAVAAHVAGGRLAVSSAGHPPPVLLVDGVATEVPVETGPPLALETGDAGARQTAVVDLPAGGLVVLHTDGLTDRQGAAAVRSLDLLAMLATGSAQDPAAVADALLRAAEDGGPASDDVTVLVLRT